MLESVDFYQAISLFLMELVRFKWALIMHALKIKVALSKSQF